jgi:hypothetical protein
MSSDDYRNWERDIAIPLDFYSYMSKDDAEPFTLKSFRSHYPGISREPLALTEQARLAPIEQFLNHEGPLPLSIHHQQQSLPIPSTSSRLSWNYASVLCYSPPS